MSLLQEFIPRGWGNTCSDTPLMKYWTRHSCHQLHRLVFTKIFKFLYGSPIRVFFTAVFYAVILSVLVFGSVRGFGVTEKKVTDENGDTHKFEVVDISTREQLILFFSFFGSFLIMGFVFGLVIYLNGFRIPPDVVPNVTIDIAPPPLETIESMGD